MNLISVTSQKYRQKLNTSYPELFNEYYKKRKMYFMQI